MFPASLILGDKQVVIALGYSPQAKTNIHEYKLIETNYRVNG